MRPSSATSASGTSERVGHSLSQSLGTFNNSKSVTAPEQEGYEFLCWLGAASVGSVKSVYLEWLTAPATKAWVLGGGSVSAYAFALYTSSAQR